jgi:hypothetical protein
MKYVKFVFQHVINSGGCVNNCEMCFVLSVFPAMLEKHTGALNSDGASSCKNGTPSTPEFAKGTNGQRRSS